MSADEFCLVCQRNAEQIPLIRLKYRQSDYWICPQHLPVLIHEPGQLIGKLPDAEHLSPAGHNPDCDGDH